MKIVNNLLNSITMYRLMLYFLLVLTVYASVLGFLGIIPYNGLDILLSSFYLATICRFSNEFFAKILKIPTNIESSLISGFILGLIFGPVDLFTNIIPLTFIAVAAMASKYLLAWKGRHIFNPAAFGVTMGALVLHHGASWWVGTIQVAPVLLIGGFLILKKIRRFKMLGAYYAISSLIFILAYTADWSMTDQLQRIIEATLIFLIATPVLFFSIVMLTEPQTSPYKFRNQIIYAFLTALLFNLLYLLPLPFSIPIPLEFSLLSGNIFAYMANKSFRQTLKLSNKINRSKDIISFLFEPQRPIKFQAGQYLEWTLTHPKPDSRGVRRYFTISSSPTEGFLMITTKFAEKSSTFKSALKNMKEGDEIVVANLEGDFTLPKDKSKKLVFIAGGIGITPFRSMTKNMLDTGEKRDIILLYSNKTKEDVVFKDLFDKAKEIDLRAVYVNTDTDGYIDEKLIKKEVEDWKDRVFYVSGPEPMVEAFEQMLKKMGLPGKQIKTDFFPGYA